MIPPNAALRLRQRNVWESLDAGVLLWRENLAALLAFFGLPLLVLAIAPRFLPGNWAYLSWLTLWWLKPLYDRLILHVVATGFFEPKTRFSRLLGALPGRLWPGLGGDLSWRRFSPWRAANAPIRALELTRGKGVKARRQSLARGGNNASAALMPLLFSMELFLLLTVAMFALIMVELLRPDTLNWNLMDWKALERIAYAISVCLVFLMEGLFSSMGFCLYINSRVVVEGWDLQLGFNALTRVKDDSL
jgi:hypothetical protein